MNDAQCTSCHAQLEAHVQPGTGLQFASHITSFAYPDGHPEFRALSTPDPGWLKFTHAQHLLPGMPRVPGEEGWFRLDQIDPAEREAFRRPGQGDRDLVELDCRACHTLDPHDDSLGLADRQVSGDYFLPVRYKQHCRACHPLSIDPVRSNESLAAAPREEPLDTTLQAPHGLQPSALREWLDLQWLAEWVAADGMILSDPLPADRHPALTQPALPATFAEAQQRDVDQSLSLLLQHAKACGKCHYFERQGQPRAILSASDVGRDNSSWRVIPPAAPRVWLDHARFNHRSHRAVHCRECHAQAFPDTSTAARWDAAAEGKLVMLPGIDTCRQCHAPAHSSWSTTTGGARHDCTECHLYHHGDFPRRGPGDPARAANLPRSIHELLQVHPPVIPATDVQP